METHFTTWYPFELQSLKFGYQNGLEWNMNLPKKTLINRSIAVSMGDNFFVFIWIDDWIS